MKILINKEAAKAMAVVSNKNFEISLDDKEVVLSRRVNRRVSCELYKAWSHITVNKLTVIAGYIFQHEQSIWRASTQKHYGEIIAKMSNKDINSIKYNGTRFLGHVVQYRQHK